MAARKPEPISEAESVVMQVFWKRGALTAEDVLAAPVPTRNDWLSNESHGFLDRLFGGRVAPLVSYFSQQKELRRKDIEELKRLIRELGDER